MKQSKQARAIKKLVTKALKDKPKWKPAKGYKYLKDLKAGSLFVTESGTRGVLIECDTNARVLITKCNNNDELGRKIIAAKTEVKEII
tara:strand:- start:329 stop:592 length:264 start_codon:yes stop_codon:yes gene_type:complete